jgi:hypothetical protein
VHPFFRDNLSSGAYAVLKELNQDPELLKSLYRMSMESFPLLAEFTGPQVQKKDTTFRIAVSRGKTADYFLVRNIYLLVATDTPHMYKKTHHCLTICFLHCHSFVVTVSVMHAY